MNKKELEKTINEILDTLEQNFKYSYGKKISFDDVFELMNTLSQLFDVYINENLKECCETIIKRYIPLLNLLIAVDNNTIRKPQYHDMLKNSYKIAAKRSFLHWLIYYEWDLSIKVFEPRVKVLDAYIYYLNYMCWNKKDLTLVVNLPSGWAKTYTYAHYCAFRIGTDQDGTFLSICSNDDLVKQMSRTIINIIKSEQFGNVFENLDYRKDPKGLFAKETDGEWKIKGNTKAASYIAKSRDANSVGFRSYYSTFCDDMYKNPDESLDMNLNRRLMQDYQTVWTERTAKGYPKQFVLAGTIWSPYDLMTQVIELEKTKRKFKKHPKFDFTEISEDGKVVIIKVPALNEYGESNCPEIATTQELLDKKRSISTYLFECNFQQHPIPPEGLPFDYKNLKTYQTVPPNKYQYTKGAIDCNRKSGKDFFGFGIFQYNDEDWEMVDSLFTQTATTELYDDIVDKIIENHTTELVIETNANEGLVKAIEERLSGKGITWCTIIEKYNTMPKAQRIDIAKGTATKRIIYPAKGVFGINTDMGRFMEQFTTYSAVSRNVHDDGADLVALFVLEIVEERSKPQKAEVLDFVRRYM
jgi:hypothetical protein